MPNETHLVDDTYGAERKPECQFTDKPPNEWPEGHDMTGKKINATCFYCVRGLKHPNAASLPS